MKYSSIATNFTATFKMNLYCTNSSDKMLQITEANPNWPLYADVFNHPPCLPNWSNTTPVDATAQWREDWQSASVINYTIVTDPTIQQPDFLSPSSVMVSAEPFSDRSRSKPCNSTQMEPCQITDM